MGFSATLLGTWEILLVYVVPSDSLASGELQGPFPSTDMPDRQLGLGLLNGGTAGLIWGFVACIVGFSLVYASLAELASM